MGRHRQVKFCSYHITYFEIRLYVGLITIKVKFLLHDDNWPTETAAGTTRGGRGKRRGGRGAKRLQDDVLEAQADGVSPQGISPLYMRFR